MPAQPAKPNGPQSAQPTLRTVTITIVDRPGLGPSITTVVSPPFKAGETGYDSLAVATACAMQDHILKLQRKPKDTANRKADPRAN